MCVTKGIDVKDVNVCGGKEQILKELKLRISLASY